MSSNEITRLLRAWNAGDQAAFDKVSLLVYKELHRLARSYMIREKPDHTLQATALINEAYVRLIDSAQMDWKDRAHFFAVAAKLMRRILVDFARTRGSQKRGADLRPVELEESAVMAPQKSAAVQTIDEALKKLAVVDPRKSQIVELRFFGGLTVAETAEVLKLAESTVYHDYDLAKLWLLREITGRD